MPDMLWRLVLSGIDQFVTKRRNFGQQLHFQHYAATDGWNMQCLFTVDNARRSYNVNGFPASNYRSLINPKNPHPLKISDFTAIRQPFQGATNNNTFHGKGNLDYMIKHMFLQQGPAAVEDALQHPWIVIDPGIINAIGGGVVTGKVVRNEDGRIDGIDISFTRFLFGNRGRYSPVDHIITEQTERIAAFDEQIGQLAEFHPRTMNGAEYERHAEVYVESRPLLSESNLSRKALANRQKLKRRRQKYLSTITNRLLRHVDAVQGDGPGRTPMVLVGGSKFNSSQHGNRASATTAISTHLATKFPVFFIDEYCSSKNCPKCFTPLCVVSGTRNRNWICKNEGCKSAGCSEPFMVNKDKSAAINMFLCMVAMMMSGKRPKPFRRPDKKKDKDEKDEKKGKKKDGGGRKRKKNGDGDDDDDDGGGNQRRKTASTSSSSTPVAAGVVTRNRIATKNLAIHA